MSVPVNISGINTVEDLVARMEAAGYSVKKLGTENPGKFSALDEKHFRRLESFNGERVKFREWLFNLEVVLARIDPELGKVVKA